MKQQTNNFNQQYFSVVFRGLGCAPFKISRGHSKTKHNYKVVVFCFTSKLRSHFRAIKQVARLFVHPVLLRLNKALRSK